MKPEEKYTFNLDIVASVIQKLNDVVVPSMGAKGRMAIIDRGLGEKPLITDDGVTIAKEARNIFTREERAIYQYCIEAMHNVEKTAYDGTTLTILMLNEFYKYGKMLVELGVDNQEVAEEIQIFAKKIIDYLNENKHTEITPEIIKSVATVSTKMPLIGEIIASAHEMAGDDMNVIIEHNRQADDYQHEVIRDEGFVLDMEGYYGDEFNVLTTDDKQTRTEFDDARIVLLSSGGLEQDYAINFFKSIPVSEKPAPLVFVISKNFDPKSLQLIINTLVNTGKARAEKGIPAHMFQFIMLEPYSADRRFLDIAAYTSGTIQDDTLGTKAYRYEHCGYAKKIIIEKHKTTIIKDDNHDNIVAIDRRVADYQNYLESNKYTIGRVDEVDIKKSISALTSGVIKILIATPTRSEFEFVRLKLDDAIGTVKMVCRNGYINGSGRELLNYYFRHGTEQNKELLIGPMKNILTNAGFKFDLAHFKKKDYQTNLIYDVKEKKYTDCNTSGIFDSFEAYKTAISNASSVVSQLIRGYVYIVNK